MRQEKKNSRRVDWEEKIKLFCSQIQDFLWRKSERSDKNQLLELISNYGKVVKYKFNIQKLITLLYTNNEPVEFEIRNT